MSNKRICFGIVTAALVAFCGACQPPTINKETAQTNATVLATADRGYALTVRDFYDALYKSIIEIKGGYLANSVTQWLLDSTILDTLTGFAADDFDLSKFYGDYWVYKERYTALLVDKYYTLNITPQSTVDSAEVIEYHKKHADRFSLLEQAFVYHVMASPTTFKTGPDSSLYKNMSPDSLDDAVRDYIFHLRRLVDSGMSFKEVASRYSHDATTKNEAGAMGWVTKGVYQPPFDSVLFLLKPGEYSHPYRDPGGWHMLMMADYLAAGPSPIDRPEFFDQVKQLMTNARRAAVVKAITDSLSKGIDLKVNQMVLDTDVFKVADSIWCAVVNGVDTIDVQTIKTMDDTYRTRYRVANTTPDMKKVIIGSFVQRQLLVQAARRDGLDTLPDVKAQQHLMRHSAGKSVLIRQWFDRAWQPSDSAIADYYNRHQKQFLVEKPLTVQQILTKDSATALFLRDQAMAGVDFMELAREYYPGEATVREALADLGKIGPRDVDSTFYVAAYGTPVGEVSMPVKSRYGYHIIKVIDHNDSRSLDDARLEIVQTFTEQYRRNEMLKHKAELGKRYNLRHTNRVGRVFLEPVAYRTR